MPLARAEGRLLGIGRELKARRRPVAVTAYGKLSIISGSGPSSAEVDLTP